LILQKSKTGKLNKLLFSFKENLPKFKPVLWKDLNFSPNNVQVYFKTPIKVFGKIQNKNSCYGNYPPIMGKIPKFLTTIVGISCSNFR